MKIVILLLVAYLLGSIPSGVWIGKLFFKKDIRQFGSGNTGTTNTFRVLGKPAGITVLLMDILKGTLATSLPYLFGLQGVNPLFFGVAAVLGHTFPIFANFKGGKAVATSAGMLLAYSPTFFLYFTLIIYCVLNSSLAGNLLMPNFSASWPVASTASAIPHQGSIQTKGASFGVGDQIPTKGISG